MPQAIRAPTELIQSWDSRWQVAKCHLHEFIAANCASELIYLFAPCIRRHKTKLWKWKMLVICMKFRLAVSTFPEKKKINWCEGVIEEWLVCVLSTEAHSAHDLLVGVVLRQRCVTCIPPWKGEHLPSVIFHLMS